jgi:hypothetical protein
LKLKINLKMGLGIGDWGLGIGGAQSPIPNPQSPIPNKELTLFYSIIYSKLIKTIFNI